MRYYFYSAGLILLAILVVTFIPYLTDSMDVLLTSLQIPQNNAQVAGIQKYNIPPVSKNLPLPKISARAVLIEDLGSGAALYQKNASVSYPIASTTKIMTAIVASEYFKPNAVLSVDKAANTPGSTAGLLAGENLTFKSLLYAMLLASGNDAAFTIAENYPGGLVGFVSAMNKKALGLGLSGTRFDNPAGFDSLYHYSSAKDMAKITEEALKDERLARIFATRETNIVSLNRQYIHPLLNLNKLLSSVSGVMGVKTGTTEAAKENLITLVDRDNHRVLLVVLGTTDRFTETTRLIDWTYANFKWPTETGTVRQ